MKLSVEGRPLDEAELIERAKHGDLDAYTDLVRLHQQVAVRVAAIILGDPSEAEDVTQDAFVKAHRHLPGFIPQRPFRPWLLAIVRNEARNRRRGSGRRSRLELQVANDPISGGAAPSPEVVVVEDEQRQTLLAAVDMLPDRFRMAVVCRYLLDLSEAETAAVLGVPPGTVKSRTARGLERLRQGFEEANA